MSLTPGTAAIDPADYPCKALIDGHDPFGDTLMMWLDSDPLPLADDVLETMQELLERGGSVLIMAKCPDVLDRVEAVVLMVAEPFYRQPGAEQAVS